MVKPRIGQIWRKKASGDRVKVIKLFGSEVKVIDTDGSNQGKQYMIPNHKLNNVDYILISNA
ncbi:hypothetical protein ACFL3T_01235 [Patescibacteria group bacterium]